MDMPSSLYSPSFLSKMSCLTHSKAAVSFMHIIVDTKLLSVASRIRSDSCSRAVNVL